MLGRYRFLTSVSVYFQMSVRFSVSVIENIATSVRFPDVKDIVFIIQPIPQYYEL